jgi:hypothetical protein
VPGVGAADEVVEVLGQRHEFSFRVDHDLLHEALCLFQQAAQRVRLAATGRRRNEHPSGEEPRQVNPQDAPLGCPERRLRRTGVEGQYFGRLAGSVGHPSAPAQAPLATELDAPVVGDLRVGDAGETTFKRPMVAAQLWSNSGSIELPLLLPIFDPVLVCMERDTFSLQGIELDAAEQRVTEYVQVWRCTKVSPSRRARRGRSVPWWLNAARQTCDRSTTPAR